MYFNGLHVKFICMQGLFLQSMIFVQIRLELRAKNKSKRQLVWGHAKHTRDYVRKQLFTGVKVQINEERYQNKHITLQLQPKKKILLVFLSCMTCDHTARSAGCVQFCYLRCVGVIRFSSLALNFLAVNLKWDEIRVNND